jgi:16S rRNA (cytidine1402-2'-O)-methyltransferase
VAVCRELTKLHEEIWRGTLAAACQEWEQREPRGEFTLVIAGATEASAEWDEHQVQTALNQAVAAGVSLKDAVRQVTVQSGWAKREVYALAHTLKNTEK